jgi:hypothetical protein
MIRGASVSVFMARMVISSGLPIGVATIKRIPGFIIIVSPVDLILMEIS